ncbi:hypothetical protein Agub_g7015 [Astrephomene gubernaculifera]|uniref:TMEM205-like domain-containing protein n=1 Tax=Astrephomene gubernaculifera TaxID=47775 RepID=A0AAD3DPK3_9CHLO|nr:hypothetical protein Agub_g7015 [Astrephomene gubernaculifera]
MMQAPLALPSRSSHVLRLRTTSTTPSLPAAVNLRRSHRLPTPLKASTDTSSTSVDAPGHGPTLPLTPAPATAAAAAADAAAATADVSTTTTTTAAPPDSTTTPAAAATETAPIPPTATATAAAALNENFTGDMLQPSVINSPYVRAASVVAAVAAVAGSTMLLPNAVGAFLHVSAYAILLGTQLWNTFFVGITMFKNLPRQTFGRVQAKLFPQYFALTTGANLMALATLFLAGAASTAPGLRALVALGVALAGTLVNWLYIEPICTGLMFQRYDIENQAEKTDADKDRIAALYKQFGKWHGISSLINLVAFCVAVSHGWFLASLLVMY